LGASYNVHFIVLHKQLISENGDSDTTDTYWVMCWRYHGVIKATDGWRHKANISVSQSGTNLAGFPGNATGVHRLRH
jgi:hypothetical protein